MILLSAKYTSQDETSIQLTYDNGEKPQLPQENNNTQSWSDLKQWVADGNEIAPWKTPEELIVHNKKEQRQHINQVRDHSYKDMKIIYTKEGIEYSIDAHAKARKELNSAIINILINRSVGAPDGNIKWTTSDDQDIDFTYTDIINIGQLGVVEYARIHEESRVAKNAL